MGDRLCLTKQCSVTAFTVTYNTSAVTSTNVSDYIL